MPIIAYISISLVVIVYGALFYAIGVVIVGEYGDIAPSVSLLYIVISEGYFACRDEPGGLFDGDEFVSRTALKTAMRYLGLCRYF